jgi:hypothetical protein
MGDAVRVYFRYVVKLFSFFHNLVFSRRKEDTFVPAGDPRQMLVLDPILSSDAMFQPWCFKMIVY